MSHEGRETEREIGACPRHREGEKLELRECEKRRKREREKTRVGG